MWLLVQLIARLQWHRHHARYIHHRQMEAHGGWTQDLHVIEQAAAAAQYLLIGRRRRQQRLANAQGGRFGLPADDVLCAQAGTLRDRQRQPVRIPRQAREHRLHLRRLRVARRERLGFVQQAAARLRQLLRAPSEQQHAARRILWRRTWVKLQSRIPVATRERGRFRPIIPGPACRRARNIRQRSRQARFVLGEARCRRFPRIGMSGAKSNASLGQYGEAIAPETRLTRRRCRPLPVEHSARSVRIERRQHRQRALGPQRQNARQRSHVPALHFELMHAGPDREFKLFPLSRYVATVSHQRQALRRKIVADRQQPQGFAAMHANPAVERREPAGLMQRTHFHSHARGPQQRQPQRPALTEAVGLRVEIAFDAVQRCAARKIAHGGVFGLPAGRTGLRCLPRFPARHGGVPGLSIRSAQRRQQRLAFAKRLMQRRARRPRLLPV